MSTFYVATLARYVLVDALDEDAARAAGHAALVALETGSGRVAPTQIRTVRLATPEEIELDRWNNESLARDAVQPRA